MMGCFAASSWLAHSVLGVHCAGALLKVDGSAHARCPAGGLVLPEPFCTYFLAVYLLLGRLDRAMSRASPSCTCKMHFTPCAGVYACMRMIVAQYASTPAWVPIYLLRAATQAVCGLHVHLYT